MQTQFETIAKQLMTSVQAQLRTASNADKVVILKRLHDELSQLKATFEMCGIANLNLSA